TAVPVDVALVGANVTSVLASVNSVMAQVSAVGTQVSILAQRKGRSQHRKHQQTNDSSSHIASLVFGPDWPLGRLNTGSGRQFQRCHPASSPQQRLVC